MRLRFLSVEAVVALHAAVIQDSGGAPGLRDAGLLESAVLRAVNKSNYEPETTVAVLAASFSFGLIKNHAFIDGNKRIGLAALLDFLHVNGFRLDCLKSEILQSVLDVAAGNMGEAAWTAWVERVATPLSQQNT